MIDKNIYIIYNNLVLLCTKGEVNNEKIFINNTCCVNGCVNLRVRGLLKL